MVTQWLGWEPPGYQQADIARERLNLQRQELAGAREDRRAALERALSDESWMRQFRERQLEQDWARALLGEVGRGARARETTKRLGEQFDVSERRRRTEARMDDVMRIWDQLPESARERLRGDPVAGPLIKERLGFEPPVEKEPGFREDVGVERRARRKMLQDVLEAEAAVPWTEKVIPGKQRRQKKAETLRKLYEKEFPGGRVGPERETDELQRGERGLEQMLMDEGVDPNSPMGKRLLKKWRGK